MGTKQRPLKRIVCILVITLILGWQAMTTHIQPIQADTQERPLLLAHYMPWYQTPEISGQWGWHWTMDHFDPSQTDEKGRPQIASHFTPLTGPYDSNDDALLEYQVLLMKLSGIDGVIVDWYGMENFRDYAALNESTGKLFEYVKKAGLLFVICYEDQSIGHMVDANRLTAETARAHGQEVMQYMQTHWFSDDAYLKVDGSPVLFTFGPQYFKSSTDWENLFSVLETPPGLVTLDKHMVSGSLSSYPWPPMFGITMNQAALEAYLEPFYRKAGRWEYIVGGAFPGFHDIYQEAGVRASYGYLDAEQGETFRFTLQMALDQNPDVIQLITWNDYGEGTNIEPTEEFGYQYLEIVQTTRQAAGDLPFTADDLRLPLQLFKLRKTSAGDVEVNTQLDTAFDALLTGNRDAAAAIIAAH
ncbi:MAG: glycoside hydrolase family 99-like domain-containing protein [Chloroflexi bacterium]|nr:glycoside hydrolase family 99-like domain-containing protein [Chloroflexota bacterium]